MSNYCVTRQIQWPDGDLCVELSVGSSDYTNPGGLMGYLSEHDLAIEAAEEAIAEALKWQKETTEEVFIGWGCTGGWTMPFDLETLDDETFTRLREWAKERDDKLPKCDHCGNPIAGDDWWTNAYSDSDTRFCSESCADRDYEEQWKADQLDDEEEEENDD